MRQGRLVAIAALLALSGCMRACFGGFPIPPHPSPVEPSSASEAAEPARVTPRSELCSFEESQRLTRLLEKDRAAELREVADRSGGTELSMVPLRLEYDGAGQIEDARLRISGHDEFAREVAEAAKAWRLDGVHRAGACDLAVQLPRSEVPPDAGDAEEQPGDQPVE
ncbi:MAG: hypothetical protein QM765_27875 [Myxococcales bacterium]